MEQYLEHKFFATRNEIKNILKTILMKKITFLLLSLIIFSGCSKTGSQGVMIESNGQINQILVVMSHDMWKGVEGEELRKVTDDVVLGLPQNEPQFKVLQIPIQAFKNLFKHQKNILIARIGKDTGFKVQTNVFARPQKIITITAKDSESLINEIQNRKQQIIHVFKSSDIEALQYRLRKKQFDVSKLKTLKNLGIDLEIPSSYKLVDDTGDFLWFRRHIKQGQSMNLIVYELPINSIEDEEGKYINTIRDTIGKKYISGQFEGSYYITEQAYTPHTFLVELAGKKTFETRGKWEIKNDFMAGPFLNYTVVDKENNRLIVIEGFTYAPASNKRDYMFELEAILKTFKFKE